MLREDVKTKEDLVAYLEMVEGLPLLEDLWELCVKKGKENEGKGVPMMETNTTDKNGKVTTKKQVAGVVITDPVKWYFRMMGLPQYKKRVQELLEEKEKSSESKTEIMETYFDDDSEEEFNDIINWINMFPDPKERQYLKQKYASYYDNYEINDGADRVSLSRILSLEIELYRINILRAKAKKVDIPTEEKLTKMLRETLESMKWTKKQRSAMDDAAQNRFSIWMDKQAKNGKFTPEHHEIPKDEIDMLIDIIPKAVAKMFD